MKKATITTLGAVVAVAAWWARRRRPPRPAETAEAAALAAGPPPGPPTRVDPPPPVDQARVELVVELVEGEAPWAGPATVTFRTATDRIELEPLGGGRFRTEAPTTTGTVSAETETLDVIIGARRLTTVWGIGPVRLDVVAADTPLVQLGGRTLPVDVDDTTVGLVTEPPLDPGARRQVQRAAAELGLDPLEDGSGTDPLRFRRPADRDLDEVIGALERAVEAVAPGATVRSGFDVRSAGTTPVLLTDRLVLHLHEPAAGAADPRRSQQGQVDERARLDRVLDALGAELVRPLWIDGAYEIRVRRGGWRTVLRTIEELTAEGVIHGAEPELVAPVVDAAVTLADYTASGTRSAQLDRMDLATAWSITLGDPSIRVATFDRGVDVGSPFVAAGTLLAVPDAAAIHPGGVDHGMAVYSVVSGQGLGGCWGVAPNGGHAVGRLTSFFGIDYWAGLDALAAAPGVRVVSLSHEGHWGANLSLGIETLHQIADRGVLIVAAAGNAAARVAPLVPTARPDCDGSPTPPSSLVDNPIAAHPRVMAVGLTEVQPGGEFAWLHTGGAVLGSNRGDTVDLCAACDGLTTASASGPVASSGTSMAAPAVAATAALMLAVRPELSPVQLRSLLCRSADSVVPSPGCSAPPGGIELGDHVRHGVAVRPWDEPTVAHRAHDLEIGFGRLNIGRAVRYAQSYPAEPVPW